MYERSRVNGKVERGSTFTLSRDLPYIVFILFTRVNFTKVLTSNIRDSGNHLNFLKPPSLTPLAKREMIRKRENGNPLFVSPFPLPVPVSPVSNITKRCRHCCQTPIFFLLVVSLPFKSDYFSVRLFVSLNINGKIQLEIFFSDF